MPREEQRVFTHCRVDFSRFGRRLNAVTQDVSRHGFFLRTEDLMAQGDLLDCTLHLPDGAVIELVARVAHVLTIPLARMLGRQPGMGMRIVSEDYDARQQLDAFIELAIIAARPLHPELHARTTVLVADNSPRLLERISTALRETGLQVEVAFNGADAYSACMEQPPDLLLIASDLAVMDGWTLLGNLAAKPRLGAIITGFMSEDATDITRLRAYRLGVGEFFIKPFTDEELTIRMQRLVALVHRRDVGSVVLRGTLGEIRVGTLLSLLDYERKSGILVLTNEVSARVYVAQGRVVKVEMSTALQSPMSKLVTLLDWHTGAFEFIACEVVGADEVGVATQHILLEHARLRDEQARRGR